MLRRLSTDQVKRLDRVAVDPDTLAQAAAIVSDVRDRGETALREHAERLGDLPPVAAEAAGAAVAGTPAQPPLVLGPEVLEQALVACSADERALLERTATRVRSFAEAQRACLVELDVPLSESGALPPGDGGAETAGCGRAGHRVAPMDVAGCYAPGGRFPLPSSVLMTAVVARAAGVKQVWVASPRPTRVTLAAAAVAGADGVLAVGGAQAIAALAYGVGGVPACDAIVGPGNRWVTAAKQWVAGRVAIDMLAGPSELVVCADASADPAVVAADLLAQAEHDPDALPVLITLDASLADAVDTELATQLTTLPTRANAEAALKNGFAVQVSGLQEAAALCDVLAPEHLELHLADGDLQAIVPMLRHYGGLFVGAGAAEVLGDYGAGPNHVLPTGGSARFVGGLSVLTFLKVQTWLKLAPGEGQALARDAAALARLEGLEAHARAAEARLR